ncbi:MAG: isoprenylcysteine carboxylmethyltransferase family protein [Candidatus Cybelea sp.]
MALRLVLVVIGMGLYLGLAVAGMGGFAAFFSHPSLIALTVLFFALAIVALFAGGNVSPGVREDRGNRWVVWVFIVVGFADAYIPAWCDSHGVWTLDGEAVRWLGVLIVAVGGTLRIAPIFTLGNRFSGLAAIQPNHALVTSGLYGTIRHPSYLGLLLSALGWGLAFRSAIGVLVALSLIIPLVARMNAEERLLASHFGAPYDAYRAKTWRLIPGVY